LKVHSEKCVVLFHLFQPHCVSIFIIFHSISSVHSNKIIFFRWLKKESNIDSKKEPLGGKRRIFHWMWKTRCVRCRELYFHPLFNFRVNSKFAFWLFWKLKLFYFAKIAIRESVSLMIFFLLPPL
jgi:hypothetical protein